MKFVDDAKLVNMTRPWCVNACFIIEQTVEFDGMMIGFDWLTSSTK